MKHIKFLILSSVSMFLFVSVAFVADVFAANPHFTPMSLLPQSFASASDIKVAGIYWLPDYLKGNVSRGNDDPDKNPFDEDCEKNYNLHTTCPTPKISTGEIHVTNELTCQKKCICPSSYQYHTGNCSGSKAPTGASCNDTEGDGYLKYTQCHCTSSYPHTTATCKGEYQVGGVFLYR